jgi:hypothetical protein
VHHVKYSLASISRSNIRLYCVLPERLSILKISGNADKSVSRYGRIVVTRRNISDDES